MNLPINIQDLLTARTVESERLEFKSGWNPESILHTLCAFANDFHNLGGGYIIIGIEEENGKAILPPKGLALEQLDKIQKELLELGNRIVPAYHPIIAQAEIQGRHLLVLWASGGQTRPYKAPVSLSKENKQQAYYLRKGSVTVKAKAEDEKELFNLAATIPYDDRIHHTASIMDLDLGLIRAYLQKVKSSLFEHAHQMNFLELCRRMNLVDGPDEFVRPKNVALMFFNPEPWRFFPYTQIDIVHFPQGLAAEFTETIFKGPIHIILNDALRHLYSHVILEKVIKYSDRAEADRFFNYAYGALEEALCNAVYHRDYAIREPIEIKILPDKIQIHSCPGPDRSIRDQDIANYQFVSRRYRNRRIGEFLKELEMTEGRGTGLPKILWEIEKNKSPKPIFHTDSERTFLLVEFPIHPTFIVNTDQVPIKYRSSTDQVLTKYRSSTDQVLESSSSTEIDTLIVSQETIQLIRTMENDLSRQEIQTALGIKHLVHFRETYLNPALKNGWIERTIPDKPNSSKQKYRLTRKGLELKQHIQNES